MARVDAGGRPPRLLCDVMLGRLARWLRALGYDAAYDPDAEDAALLRRAARERRLVLTRDRRIGPVPRSVRVLVLRANDIRGQMRESLAVLRGAPRPAAFTRCLRCNVRLRRAGAEQIEAKVPQFVRSSGAAFRACPRCGGVFWPGTHRSALARELEAAGGGTVSARAARPRTAPPPSRG